MADFKNYDPSRIFLSFKGYIINGYADGSFVKAERSTDAFSMSVGSGGDVVRVRNRNRTGSITMTLQGASSSNDILTAFALDDELSANIDSGVGPILIKDLNGLTICTAPDAWIRKIANYEAAMEHTNREWVFDCSELYMFVGGALV